ncbi:hypothetical protein K3495_g15449 [Podosphaera aphanis]|nr:hypothetical protein K3495_g15449 [Podosphaera aphanis]
MMYSLAQKNRVSLRPEWRLVTADAAVFQKLSQIQNALQTALVPYRLWSQRLILEMSGDFHGVRVWASGRHVTWPTLLEAIFPTMQRLDVLHSPMTIFSQIFPSKDETIRTFAWRMREAFYNLSGSDRESDTTRDLIKEIAMKRLPRVWTLAQPHSIGLTNYEIIEMIVQVATRVSKWPIEDQVYAQPD